MNESVNLFLRNENRVFSADAKRYPLPVTLITGFLGAGKTTLLNHILSNKLNLRITCLVNDFAALNIDAGLVQRHDARGVVELSNGCMCCTLTKEVESNVWSILQSMQAADRADYLVIETSGVADPRSLVRSLDKRYGKMTRARLDSVVAVVDTDLVAAQIAQQLDEQGPAERARCLGGDRGDGADNDNNDTLDDAVPGTVVNSCAAAMDNALLVQLRCADVVLLNKTDLVPDPRLRSAVARVVQHIAPWATVHHTDHSAVPLTWILDVEDPGQKTWGDAVTHERADPVFAATDTDASSLRRAIAAKAGHADDHGSRAHGGSGHGAAHTHEHGAHGDFESITFESDHAISLALLQDFFDGTSTSSSAGKKEGADIDTAAVAGVIIDAGDDRDHDADTKTDGHTRKRRKVATALPPALLAADAGVVRMKGVLYFQEDRAHRWILSLSGRRRLELVQAGKWDGPPSVGLVAIGRKGQLKRTWLQTQLHRLLQPDHVPSHIDAVANVPSITATGAADCAALMKEDNFFELIHIDSATHLVHFQLVAARAHAISRLDVVHLAGVDIDAMNQTLAKIVNSTSSATAPCAAEGEGGILLAAGWLERDDRRDFTLRYAPGGRRSLRTIWTRLHDLAMPLVSEYFENLPCKCGDRLASE